MIKFISDSDVLPLRNEVLREGRLTLPECRFATDALPGSFHVGGFEQEQLVCIASFHIQSYGNEPGIGYQLRGMATSSKYQGTGVGSRLVRFAIADLKQKGAAYVWCNARKKAAKFYGRLGFVIVSDEFEVPGIGPHYAMYLDLKTNRG
jgi:predicted GNAT family N-acyltransferase